MITATTDEKTNNWRSWNITAADADTTTTFTHGMGAAPGYPAEGPDAVWAVNELQPTTTVAFVWGVQWNQTTITLMKAANAGSGGGVPGTTVVAKLYAWRPHSAAR